MARNKTWLGIGAGIAAGALWGLVFLAPELTAGFTSMQLSAGRYLAYGLISAVLIAPSWKRLARTLTLQEWKGLIWLSLTGNIVYYVLLAAAVQMGGVAMASLVIGLLPVAVTIIGSRDAHAVPFRKLIPSILFGLAGLLCISWQSLSTPGQGSFLGLLCAIGALVAWTTYAVANSRWLGSLHSVSAHEWSLLTGVVTGLEALVLAVPAFLMAATPHPNTEWLYFAGIVTGIAFACSIIGNALWNYASRALPLTLMGQMIVFETIFAALYGFLWEHRWPTTAESLAMVLLIAGVASCASVHQKKNTAQAELGSNCRESTP